MSGASNPTSALRATSDYYGTSPAISFIRGSLRAVQTLSPALAVRLAYRLFGTPLPLKWSNRRRSFDESWQLRRWTFENAGLITYTGSGDTDIERTVLLVHGWGGHAAQMLPIAGSLRANGYSPVVIEMPAHGMSAGTRSNLPQFARAIEYIAYRLQQQGRHIHAVIAHSLGANAAAYAASRNLPLKKLVLLAPPASPQQFTRLFAHVFALSELTRSGMQRRIEETEAILMPLLEPQAVGPRINVPTLVVHDRGDRINAFADGVAYSQNIANAKLLATEGLGHRRLLVDEQVSREIVDFLGPAEHATP